MLESLFNKRTLFKETPTRVFSCEYFQILSEHLFGEHLRTTPSELTHFTRMIHPEAVTQRCSVKKVLLEILQNSQENTCARA